MSIKVLTLTQPFATLISLGAKTIETRSWSTSYRGQLLIHAAAGLGPVGGAQGLLELCRSEPFRSTLINAGFYGTTMLPRGAIIAVCSLIACKPMPNSVLHGGWAIGLDEWDLTDQERAFGNYSPGRFAWLLADIRALPRPIPARGALGLWNWEGELPPC